MKSGFPSESSSLISQLKSLVPMKHKSFVLRYLAIYPVPLLGNLFQDKDVRNDYLQAGLPGRSNAVPFGYKHYVDAKLKEQNVFFSLPPLGLIFVCSLAFPLHTCLPFLPSLVPSLSPLLSHLTYFSVYEIQQHIYYPWVTPQTIKKMHFSMMKCHTQ